MEVTKEMWAVASAAVSGLVMYLVGKRKSKADAIAAELANVEKAISIYRGIAKDLQTEIQQLKAELEKLYQQNSAIRIENRDLKKKLQHLERKLDELSNKS